MIRLDETEAVMRTSLTVHLFLFLPTAEGCSISFLLFLTQINAAACNACNELQCHWKEIQVTVYSTWIKSLHETEQLLPKTDWKLSISISGLGVPIHYQFDTFSEGRKSHLRNIYPRNLQQRVSWIIISSIEILSYINIL